MENNKKIYQHKIMVAKYKLKDGMYFDVMDILNWILEDMEKK